MGVKMEDSIVSRTRKMVKMTIWMKTKIQIRLLRN